MPDNDKTLAEAGRELNDRLNDLGRELERTLPKVGSVRQHVIVIGLLLVAVGVMVWLSYFGPLA